MPAWRVDRASTTCRTLDLTIIIVSWNVGGALRGCLQSIRNCRTRHPVRVIVVDNASTDGSPEIVQREFPEAQLLNSGGNLGFARANNLARPHTTSELVLFLNPDSVVQPGTLDAMVAAMEASPEVGALSCKMKCEDGRVYEQLVQRFPSPWTEFLGMILVSAGSRRRLERTFPYLDPHRSGYVSKLCGGCFMARKSVLDAVGWFDERYFMYAEDVDLSRTIHDRGWTLFYVSEGEISHVGGESSRQTTPEFPTLMRCESIAKLMRKYYGRLGLFCYRLGTLVGALVRLVLLGVLAVARWFLPGYRKYDLAGAVRKYRLMLQWSVGLKRAEIPGTTA